MLVYCIISRVLNYSETSVHCFRRGSEKDQWIQETIDAGAIV
jgi:hypothetical protein